MKLHLYLMVPQKIPKVKRTTWALAGGFGQWIEFMSQSKTSRDAPKPNIDSHQKLRTVGSNEFFPTFVASWGKSLTSSLPVDSGGFKKILHTADCDHCAGLLMGHGSL